MTLPLIALIVLLIERYLSPRIEKTPEGGLLLFYGNANRKWIKLK